MLESKIVAFDINDGKIKNLSYHNKYNSEFYILLTTSFLKYNFRKECKLALIYGN